MDRIFTFLVFLAIPTFTATIPEIAVGLFLTVAPGIIVTVVIFTSTPVLGLAV